MEHAAPRCLRRRRTGRRSRDRSAAAVGDDARPWHRCARQAPNRSPPSGAGGLRVPRSGSSPPRGVHAPPVHPILPSSAIVRRRRHAAHCRCALRNQRGPTPSVEREITSQGWWFESEQGSRTAGRSPVRARSSMVVHGEPMTNRPVCRRGRPGPIARRSRPQGLTGTARPVSRPDDEPRPEGPGQPADRPVRREPHQVTEAERRTAGAEVSTWSARAAAPRERPPQPPAAERRVRRDLRLSRGARRTVSARREPHDARGRPPAGGATARYR